MPLVLFADIYSVTDSNYDDNNSISPIRLQLGTAVGASTDNPFLPPMILKGSNWVVGYNIMTITFSKHN